MTYRRYWKFFGLFLLILALSTGLAASYIGEKVRNTLIHQIKTEIKRDTLHAARLFQPVLRRTPTEALPLYQAAKEADSSLGKRVSIISRDGHLLGDSAREHRTIDQTDDYSHRPEVIMAREKGYGEVIRFSPFMNAQTLFAAVPVFRERTLIGFVRLAQPLNELEDTVSDFRRRLILMGGLIGFLALLFGFFLIWRMGRPLKEISGMAEQMAGGHLKQPLHLLPRSEFTPLARSLEKMSKDLRFKLELLDNETSRLRAILLAMQEGVLVTNEKGLITLVNPFLRQVLGGTLNLENRTIQEVFMNTEFQEAVDQALRGEKFQRLEISLGWDAIRYFEVQVVPLVSAHLTQGAVALFHDITEIRRLLKVRQDFVANASHELRTPLTAISGALETLEGIVPADGDTRTFLGILQKNVRRMSYLVSDLLDLAQLEDQERSERVVDEVPVTEVLQSALQNISPLALEKNISLVQDLAGLSSQGASLFWEKERMHQAIFNLLDNAVKYTPPGGKVTLSAREDEKELSISIADTGLGIPKEHLARIFERFYRVDRNRSRELGGTGLGLSIVKHIVEAHKGKVEARSELGRGSIFTISFPKK